MTASKTTMGQWMDEVRQGVGRFVRLETTDGIVRSGKMTGLRTRDYKLNGRPVELITALELNGDPSDTVDFVQVAKINID